MLGATGCAALRTPSGVAGPNAAARTLSAEQLREIAATFEAQGRAEPAAALLAAADRRAGVPAARPQVPPAPAPAPPALDEPPTLLADAPVPILAEPTVAVARAPRVDPAVRPAAATAPLRGEEIPVLSADEPGQTAKDRAAGAWNPIRPGPGAHLKVRRVAVPAP